MAKEADMYQHNRFIGNESIQDTPIQSKIVTEKNLKVSRFFNDIRKLKYVIQDENVVEMLRQLEEEALWSSDCLKNNSPCNVSYLFDKIASETQ